MKFHLFDTLSRTKLSVEPSDGKALRIYCCGPTVYGPAHIGNFRTFVLQDLLRRVVELSGFKMKHVRNITDLDDKTIRQSQAEGKSLKEFTTYWYNRFAKDCELLNLLKPHVEPSAVNHIAEQIHLIQKLMEKGHAYVGGDGSVYFSISSFKHYGRLAHLDEQELRIGSADSLNNNDEYEKEQLADFALWKAYRKDDGDNTWDSPWGKGRPGWHLECSAMSMKYLGDDFDLHSGGVDLIFPHHENEIAQSECCTGKRFCRHWFHVAHLMVDGGKMSKRLGNLYTLEDILAKGFSPMDMRYVLMRGHYRQTLNFTLDTLHAAQQALLKIKKIVDLLLDKGTLKSLPSYQQQVKKPLEHLGLFQQAWEALLDDLKTPEADGKLFTGLRDVEKEIAKGDINSDQANEWLNQIAFILNAMGLELPRVVEEVAPDEIKAFAEERWTAKLAKDWARADELRLKIESLGWTTKDSKTEYRLARLKN
ncbi:MAG: cysteine--tRNA ligase [Verrucomicrobiota bacterium]